MSEARRRFREVLDLVAAGQVVEVARNGTLVAVLHPPEARPREQFTDVVDAWRGKWGVGDWADDEVFADVRDPDPGPRPEL